MMRACRMFITFVLGYTAFCFSAKPLHEAAWCLPTSQPQEVGMCAETLAAIDEVVTQAIEQKCTPGAVVLVGHRGCIVYHKAFGVRTTNPVPVPMTTDTMFDIASLTKPVVTATLAVKLIELGTLQLSDPLAKYLPEFDVPDKKMITIEQVLTHRAGFAAELPLGGSPRGNALDVFLMQAVPSCTSLKNACLNFIAHQPLLYPPGTKFVYTCQGFFVLGMLLEKLFGKQLDVAAQEFILGPLRMTDTCFCPSPKLRDRIAPTEKVDGVFLQGVVHDPGARALGGVAGNAGLFSTAADLAIFCQMVLNGGCYRDVQILSPATVALMTSPGDTPPNEMRGLGWDINTPPHSFSRGDLFPIGSYGHTGFTGVSVWLDPASQTFVIFLSNRLYPDGKGDVKNLRSKIATIVAASIIT